MTVFAPKKSLPWILAAALTLASPGARANAGTAARTQLRDVYAATLRSALSGFSPTEATHVLRQLRAQLAGQAPPLETTGTLPLLRGLMRVQTAAAAHLSPTEATAFREDALAIVAAEEAGLSRKETREKNVAHEEENLPPYTGWTVPTPASENRATAASADGRWLAIRQSDHGRLLVWDLKTKSSVPALNEAYRSSQALPAFDASGERMASLELLPDGSRRVQIRQTSDWTPSRLLPIKVADVNRLEFSPDGRKLLVFSSGEGDRANPPRIEVWDLDRDTRLLTQSLRHGGGDGASLLTASFLLHASFSPDSASVLFHGTGFGPYRIELGKRASHDPKPLGRAKSTSSQVAAFSRDGSLAAIGSAERIETFRVGDWSRPSTLKDPKARLGVVAFSRDGERLLAGSSSGKITLWDLASRRLLHAIPSRSGEIAYVEFLPNPRYAFAIHFNGDVAISDLQSEAVVWKRTIAHVGTRNIMIQSDGRGMQWVGTKSIDGLDFAELIRRGELPADLLDATASASASAPPRQPASLANASARVREVYATTLRRSFRTLPPDDAAATLHQLRARLRGQAAEAESFASLPLVRALEALERAATDQLPTTDGQAFRDDLLNLIDAEEKSLRGTERRQVVVEQAERAITRAKWEIPLTRLYPEEVATSALHPWVAVYFAEGEGSLMVWDARSPKADPVLDIPYPFPAPPVLNPTKAELATVTEIRADRLDIIFRGLPDGKPTHRLSSSLSSPTSLEYSRDGRWLMISGRSKGVKAIEVWDVATRTRVANSSVGRRTEAFFSPDSASILVHGPAGGRRIPLPTSRSTAPAAPAPVAAPVDLPPSEMHAISRDGSTIAFGSSERVRVYRVGSWKQIGNFKVPKQDLVRIGLSDDGQRLITGASDGQIASRDVASRRRVGYAKLQDDEISSIQTFPNPRYALLAQDRLKIVDLLLDRVIWIEPSSNAKESRLNFGPGWAELLVLGKRSIVNLDLAALISLGELPPDLLDASASAPPPLSGSTSPRRRQPAAVASEQLLKGYSAALHGTRFTAENATHARRHLRARLEGAPTAIENFQLEPLLRALDRLVATAERTLDTVELARFRARAADAIQAWDAARTKVQDRSRETEREETRPAKALSRKRRLPLAPSSAAVSPDGELLAVGGYANIESAAAHQLVILRAADVKPLQAEKLPDGVNAVAWSPDGQDLWVATNSATDGGAIMRWRRDQKTSRWEAVSSWSCAREPKGLAISADGRTLFSYGNHASHLEVGNDPLGETLAWDVATGTSRTLDTSRKAYEAIAYQPTSGLLATAAPHEIQIRDTLRGGEPTRIGLRLKGTASFHALAFSGDGKTLVASINERQKNPRRVATQVQVYRQNARGNWVSVHTLAMPGRMATLKPSRDGNWLLSMSPNGDLHVYDVKSGASIYSAEHQENNGNRVAFDPSGPRAFTLNLDDQKVSRWDLGELVRSGELPPGSVSF